VSPGGPRAESLAPAAGLPHASRWRALAQRCRPDGQPGSRPQALALTLRPRRRTASDIDAPLSSRAGLGFGDTPTSGAALRAAAPEDGREKQ